MGMGVPTEQLQAEVAALREQAAELEQFKSKYHEAMDVLSEWKNIDDTAAIAERWNKRLAAAPRRGA